MRATVAVRVQSIEILLREMEALLRELVAQGARPPPELDVDDLIRRAQAATAETARQVNQEWYTEHLAQYHGKKLDD